MIFNINKEEFSSFFGNLNFCNSFTLGKINNYFFSRIKAQELIFLFTGELHNLKDAKILIKS